MIFALLFKNQIIAADFLTALIGINFQISAVSESAAIFPENNLAEK